MQKKDTRKDAGLHAPDSTGLPLEGGEPHLSRKSQQDLGGFLFLLESTGSPFAAVVSVSLEHQRHLSPAHGDTPAHMQKLPRRHLLQLSLSW